MEELARLTDHMGFVARGIRGEFEAWPKGACVESTIALVAVLDADGIAAVPAWGRVAFFGDYEPHAWAELPNGTILDMTAGQFIGGVAWRVVRPGDALHACYEAEARGADVIHEMCMRMVGFCSNPVV